VIQISGKSWGEIKPWPIRKEKRTTGKGKIFCP
jgi:hypothetical protein